MKRDELNGRNGSQSIGYNVSQVSGLTGVPATTLRYWECDFAPYLKPRRTTGNQRRYTQRDVEMVKRIWQLVKDQKLTNAGAKDQLRQELAKLPEPSEHELSDRATELAIRELRRGVAALDRGVAAIERMQQKAMGLGKS